MEDRNEFAMVPKSSGAVEKAKPGVKRILSEMVSQTLATVREKYDTTPLTMSMEGDDGQAIVIFKRGTIIPARSSVILPNRRRESNVVIKVVQGENPTAAKNKLVGEFVINNVLSMTGDETQVEVMFDIDLNGILHVSAKSLATGNPHDVQIASKGEGLSKNDIQRILNEAKGGARK